MIEDLLNAYRKETGASYRDSLTDLYTYGVFSMILERETKRAERGDNIFSVGLIDIDDFSHYNHTHGMVAGDSALKEIAGIISDSLRDTDFPARCYKDVFAMVLDSAQSESAGIAAERIRTSVEKAFNGEITVSIGLASFPLHADSPEQLLRVAEKSLQQAKARGKNTIHFIETEQNIYADHIPKVLIVDDSRTNQLLLASQLKPLGYEVLTASSGEQALHLVRSRKVNLILLDVVMPGIDGFEVCRRVKQDPTTRLIPVILITALDDRSAKVKGIEAGADDFLQKPPQIEELIARTKSLLNVNLLNQRLTNFENVLYSLANAVNAKDNYTQGHAARVSNLAEAVGRKLGLEEHQIRALKTAGLLHDVGKIGVSERILNKHGKLTEEEFEEMRRHPLLGYTICLPLKDNLGQALDIIRHHHERLDGSSYPDGLIGDQVSILARIMGVVDVFDALTTTRPYREAYTSATALSMLDKECREGKMDQKVVDVLRDIINTGSA
jgi:putative two-component system response regulator